MHGVPDALDPARRAKYDVHYHQQKQDRLRIVSAGAKAENDFEMEQINRLTVLEALHAKRRLEPGGSGMPLVELEGLTGRPREHLEFTIWAFLVQRKFVLRDDSARLVITADGVDFLEQNYRSTFSAAGCPNISSLRAAAITLSYSDETAGPGCGDCPAGVRGLSPASERNDSR